MQLHDVIIMIT